MVGVASCIKPLQGGARLQNIALWWRKMTTPVWKVAFCGCSLQTQNSSLPIVISVLCNRKERNVGLICARMKFVKPLHSKVSGCCGIHYEQRVWTLSKHDLLDTILFKDNPILAPKGWELSSERLRIILKELQELYHCKPPVFLYDAQSGLDTLDFGYCHTLG